MLLRRARKISTRGARWSVGAAAAIAIAAATAAAAAASPPQARTLPGKHHLAAPAAASRAPRSRHVSHGTADVAFAGSLEYLDQTVVGPAFTRATGYAYQGRGAGSDALSHEILSGEISPNVFESIGAPPIVALEPRRTGYYVQFAQSPLVLAYDPSSSFGPELSRIARGKLPFRDLFSVLAAPGFTLGRTDPNVDPQGAAFVEMIELAQRRYHLSNATVRAILGSGPLGGSTSPEIFDETALEPRLEAGQLDGASAFLSQAVQLHLHYVALPASIDLGDPADARTYATASIRLSDGERLHGTALVVDVTTLGTTDEAAADAFVAYVLSPAGRAAFARGGYTLLHPIVVGPRSRVPAAIRRALAG